GLAPATSLTAFAAPLAAVHLSFPVPYRPTQVSSDLSSKIKRRRCAANASAIRLVDFSGVIPMVSLPSSSDTRTTSSDLRAGADPWLSLSSGMQAKTRDRTQPIIVQPSDKLNSITALAFFLLAIRAINAGRKYIRTSTLTTAT